MSIESEKSMIVELDKLTWYGIMISSTVMEVDNEWRYVKKAIGAVFDGGFDVLVTSYPN